MTSLRAFEAVARHLSFTRAARELNLSQTAVSHQIKNLEELLCTRLFIRERGSVAVTEEAHRLLDSIRPLIVEVGEASARARDRKNDNTLYIGCMAAFALLILIPRLSSFQRDNPDIKLKIGMVLSTEGLARRDYDIAIRHGSGSWPGFVSDKLCEEEVFPVCSPSLLKRGPRLKKPADLARHRIIRTSQSFVLRDDWPLWLEQAGVPDLEFANEIDFDMLFPSIEAAIAGLGVSMGRMPLINAALKDGRLVEPFDVRLRSEATYFVCAPKERSQLRSVVRFKNWMRAMNF